MPLTTSHALLPPAGPAAAAACDLLLKLLPLRQPLLSRHTAEALTALCSAPGAHLGAKGLSELLGAVLGAEQLWDRRGDSATTLAATRLVEDGLCRLAAQDASLCASRLPRAFHTLVPQLAAEHEPVRFAAGACLKNGEGGQALLVGVQDHRGSNLCGDACKQALVWGFALSIALPHCLQ